MDRGRKNESQASESLTLLFPSAQELAARGHEGCSEAVKAKIDRSRAGPLVLSFSSCLSYLECVLLGMMFYRCTQGGPRQYMGRKIRQRMNDLNAWLGVTLTMDLQLRGGCHA